MLFFTGLSTTGAFNTLNTLVVDVNYHSAATVAAANNPCRCLMRAATTAFAVPLIDAIGLGWTATLIAGLWVIFSPLLWIVLFRGHTWRQKASEKNMNEKILKIKSRQASVEWSVWAITIKIQTAC
jgi:hypothetical protein